MLPLKQVAWFLPECQVLFFPVSIQKLPLTSVFLPDKVAGFGPKSLAGFGPKWVAYFTPK
jgi:hypothetical protein